MLFSEAKKLALDLLKEFDLEDVQFAWSRGKITLGSANWKRCQRTGVVTRTLKLSKHLVELNDFDEVNDVIRHEIAHFKAGRRAGHGPIWKHWAIKCGARPERCSDVANVPEGRYNLICGCCGKTLVKGRHRRSNKSRHWCRSCGRPSQGKLYWTQAA